jgi:glucosamine-6-phosphate deaminase
MSRTEAASGIQLRVVAPEQFARAAAEVVGETLQVKPDALIGLPTGNTPMPVYRELLKRRRGGEIDLSRMRAVVLDDYLGVPPDSEISFYRWLRSAFLEPAGIPDERILRIPTERENVEQHCQEFEKRLREWGGCDLQLLGLGPNGHIGFNEPGSERNSRTRPVKLTAASHDASARYWGKRPTPDWGITMGVGTILEARRILLLVNGKSKAAILRRTVEGPVGPAVPATFLRECADCRVLADEPAASLLKAAARD